MAPIATLISDGASLVIAALYTIAGQAHFTNRITPSFAAHVEEMTQNSQSAMNIFNMEYLTFKRTLGALDLLAAACLFRSSTRKVGLWLSVIGFSGGMFGQLYTGESILQVGGLLALAIVGLVTRPSNRPTTKRD